MHVIIIIIIIVSVTPIPLYSSKTELIV